MKSIKQLLYVSNYSINEVYIFSYPRLELVGTITDAMDGPDGICAAANGDVFIVDNYAAEILRFSHGGLTPKAILNDHNQYPVSCSVDPTTGNLAVTNIYTYQPNSQGSVAIYAGAKGHPKLYQDPTIQFVYFCGYDNEGNLFIDGETAGSRGAVFAELPKGSSTFTDITLSGGTISYPGNVRWDGTYVAVGDQLYQGQVQSAIYQTTGAGGAIVGTTVLQSGAPNEEVVGFTISGSLVVAPDFINKDVELYGYPVGGAPKRGIPRGFVDPIGSAISTLP